MRSNRRPTPHRVMMELLEQRLLLSAEAGGGAPTVPAPGRPDLMIASDSGSSSSDDITNINWCLHFMVGSTTAGMTVSLYADGVIIGSAVADGASTEVVTGYGITLADGASVITARQTDHSRQSGDSEGLTIYVDTAAPGATVPDLLTDSGASDSDDITTGIDPVFSGVVGDTAGLYASGLAAVELHSTDGKSVTFSASGSYEQAMPTLDEGLWSVFATVTDVAGNCYRTDSLLVYIDRSAPSAGNPDLSASSDTGVSDTDNFTKDPNPFFTGVASDPGGWSSGVWKVVVNSDDGKSGTSYASSYSVQLTGLGEGWRTVTADVYDMAGNVFTTVHTAIMEDYTAPVSAMLQLSAGSDTGMSGTDGITNDTTPTFDVTAVPYFRVYRDGVKISGDYEAGTSFTTGVQAADRYTYSVRAVDVAGNESQDNATSVLIDATSPSCHVPDLLPISDSGFSAYDDITCLTDLRFMGGAADAIVGGHFSGLWKVVVEAEDGSQVTTITTNGYGAMLTTLGEGAHTVRATAYDVAGNTYVTAGLTITVDRTAPASPRPDLAPLCDSGVSNTDHVTNIASPIIVGTAGDGTAGSDVWKVVVSSDDGVTATTISADYSVMLANLSEGLRRVKADVYDVAGNVFTTPDTMILEDYTAPGAGTLKLSAGSDTGMSSTDGITNDTTPTFDVTGGPYFRVYRGGTKISGDYEAGTSFTDSARLSDSYNYQARAVDAAGNESVASAVTVLIDAAIPSMSAADLYYLSDTGLSSTDNITTGINPRFDGTASDPLVSEHASGIWKVEIATDDGMVGMDTAAPFYSIIMPTLNEGLRTVRGTAYDVAGNTYVTGWLTVTVDRTAPDPGTITLQPGSDTGMSSSDGITKDNTPTFNISEAPKWRLYRDGTLVSGGLYSTGNTYTPPPLLDGQYTYTLRTIDDAGNLSADYPGVWVGIDTISPSASVPDLNSSSDTGTSATDNVTQGTDPQFDGTASDLTGAYNSGIWKVVVTSNDNKTASDLDGTFYSVILPTLDEGTRTVQATAYDLAGNANSSGWLTVYVDRTAPVASVPDLSASSDTGASSTDNITRYTSPTFTGTATDSGIYASGVASVAVLCDDVVMGPADSVSPFYTVLVSGMAEGVRSVTAYATDKAGNVGPTSAALTVYVDFTAPTVGIPDLAAADDTGVSDSDNITQGLTPLFTGTAGEVDSVYTSGFWKNTISDAYGTSFTPANIDGTFSQEFPDLTEGVHTITATAYDIAGNLTMRSLTVLVDRNGTVAGTLDASFGVGGKVITSFASSSAVASATIVQGDGKIVQAGSVGGYLTLARFNADGTLDDSFGVSGIATTGIGVLAYGQGDARNQVYGALQADGRIVIATTMYFGNSPDFAVVRFNSEGSLDTSFGVAGLVKTPIGVSSDYVRAVAIQDDGKILVAGSAYGRGFALARYNTDGTLDDTFGAGGIVTTVIQGTGDTVCSMQIKPDGKIMLGGKTAATSGGQFLVARYNTDGTLDASFGVGGTISTSFGANAYRLEGPYLVMQPGEKTLAIGGGVVGNGAILMARYNSDGTLDSTFGEAGLKVLMIGTSTLYSAALQADGKVLLASYGYGTSNKAAQLTVRRLNGDGTLDTSFGRNGVAAAPSANGAEYGYSMVLQPDGNILVGGYGTYSPNQQSCFLLARFRAEGPVIDMRASSDTGASDSDNITRDRAPVFDVGTAEYWRVYRDGVLVTGLYENAASYAADALADGTYSYTIRGVDLAGNESADSAVLSAVIDNAPPTLLGGQVNAGLPNRSVIVSLSAVFSEGVTGPAIGDLVVRDASGAAIDLSSATFGVDSAGVAKWDLPAGLLPDGDYSAAIESSGVADIAGNPLSGGAACDMSFFRLAGDGTGDGKVDIAEYVEWFNNYGRPVQKAGAGDLDGDGKIDVSDYVLWFNNYGHSLVVGGTGPADAGASSPSPYSAPTQQSSEPAAGTVSVESSVVAPSPVTAAPMAPASQAGGVRHRAAPKIARGLQLVGQADNDDLVDLLSGLDAIGLV